MILQVQDDVLLLDVLDDVLREHDEQEHGELEL